MCLGCKVRDEQNRLIRFVAAEGVAVVHDRLRLPGRGAWAHPTASCVRAAVPKLRRALRADTLETSQLESLASRLESEPPTEGTNTTMDA